MATQLTELFDSAGLHTWTCPEDVFGVVAECIGAGGAGDSTHGGASGAYAQMWLDVVPGEEYEVFVSSPTGDPDVSYFGSTDLVYAVRGGSASGAAGVAPRARESNGAIVAPGVDGDGFGFSPGQGGDADGNFFNLFPGGSGGFPGEDGEAPGGGGGSGGAGTIGAVKLSYWVGPAGNGGGGGGGYARSTLSVTPGADYDLYIGAKGFGQQGIVGDSTDWDEFMTLTYSPVLHGEGSWFQSESTLFAAGGHSPGSDTGDDRDVLVLGGIGGGKPGTDSNIGDVTFNGGNGGKGHPVSRYFAFIGGAGGAAASYDADGEDGGDGKDGGRPGISRNDFNPSLTSFGSRYGWGGLGVQQATDGGSNDRFGLDPGGGGGGDSCQFAAFTGFGGSTQGSAGRVLIRGVRTGRLLIPGF